MTNRHKLTRLGITYGMGWGVAAMLVALCLEGWSIGKLGKVLVTAPLWIALGVPAGIAVTHLFARRLRGASWGKLLGLAPLTLLVGTLLFGLTWVVAAWALALVTGGLAGWFFSGPGLVMFPLTCSFYAFLMVWPIGLAVLNCWHLRGMVSEERDEPGAVWKIS